MLHLLLLSEPFLQSGRPRLDPRIENPFFSTPEDWAPLICARRCKKSSGHFPARGEDWEARSILWRAHLPISEKAERALPRLFIPAAENGIDVLNVVTSRWLEDGPVSPSPLSKSDKVQKNPCLVPNCAPTALLLSLSLSLFCTSATPLLHFSTITPDPPRTQVSI